MDLGYIAAAAGLGAIGGAAEGAAQFNAEDYKLRQQEARDRLLAQLARETHAANKAEDIRQTDEQRRREEGEIAGHIARRKAATDKARADAGVGRGDERAQGENVGTVLPEAARPKSAKEEARAALEDAIATGNKGYIEAEQKRYDLVRKDEDDELRARDRQDALADRKESRDFQLMLERMREAAAAGRHAETVALQKKVMEEASKRDWTAGKDGYFHYPDGSIVTQEVREGGKLLGTKPVEAPERLLSGSGEASRAEQEIRAEIAKKRSIEDSKMGEYTREEKAKAKTEREELERRLASINPTYGKAMGVSGSAPQGNDPLRLRAQ